MIEVSLLTIVNAQQALTRLANERLPIKAAYRLKKTMRLLDTEIRDYFEARDKIIETYGEPMESGGFRIPEEDTEALTVAEATNQELLKEIIKLDIEPLPVDMLGDVSMSVAELELLDFLLS